MSAGVPVFVINSGANDWKDLGASGFVGQDESVAGEVAGQAMKDDGVTKILCVNITQVIEAVDARCEGATKGFGGPVDTIRVDMGDAAGAVAAVSAKLAQDKSIDGVLSLGGGVYTTSRDAIEQADSSAALGTFDVNDEITADLKGGDLRFALDQQPYIQGYQAVLMAALLASDNLLIGGGVAPVLSGPRLLTPENVAGYRPGRAARTGPRARPPPLARPQAPNSEHGAQHEHPGPTTRPADCQRSCRRPDCRRTRRTSGPTEPMAPTGGAA